MTAVKRGKLLEKRTDKWLTDQGFLVYSVQRPGMSFRVIDGKSVPIARKNMNHDIFGLFDHVVVAATEHTLNVKGIGFSFKKGATFYVQTKADKLYGKEMDPYKEFPASNFVFSWKKEKNGRYPLVPEIQVGNYVLEKKTKKNR